MNAKTICRFGLAFLLLRTTVLHAEELSQAEFPHIKLELIAENKNSARESNIMLGIHFQIEPGWHIYGKVPGDVGLPTEVRWKLPEGMQTSELQYPATTDFQSHGLLSHGYENELRLVSEVTASKQENIAAGFPAAADVDWVLCRDECIPGHASLQKFVSAGNSLAPASAPQTIAAAEISGPSDVTTAEPPNFLLSLGLAFLGGVLLNLMPCVFPVLSLKVLNFAHQAGSRRALHHGAVFAIGIIISFWVLGGILFAVRAFGAQVGWGFQFQSPAFVVVMGFAVFAVALNFIGVFEVGFALQRAAGKADCRSGYLGSFWSGVLATLLATPCSAPFMASAITAALTMKQWMSLIVFTFIGLGMSAPYLLLAAFPNWLRFLPSPGAWMVRLKQVLAFPLFASVIWLSWVLSVQLGNEGVIHFLSGLLLLSIGFWALGQWNVPNARALHRRLAVAMCGLSLVGATSIALPACVLLPNIFARASTDSTSMNELRSEPFTETLLAQLRSENKPVFVEFSAAWCLTCQVNHELLFHSDEVLRELKDKGVVLLNGDWTRNDPVITRAISALGRDGVPLSALYLPGKTAPVVFPPVLTVGKLVDTLKQISNSSS